MEFIGWLKHKIIKNRNLKSRKKLRFNLKEITFSSFMIQGEAPRKTDCQDSYTIIDNHKEIFYALGIFDGHGNSGKEASNSASENFLKYFKDNQAKIQGFSTNTQKEGFMKKAFVSAERKMIKSGIDYDNSGTCALILLIHNNICSIANVGNGRAVLCRKNQDITAIELSWDQTASRKDERKRISDKGAKIQKLNYKGEWVGPLRIWKDEEGPGISITRSLGDIKAKKIGFISVPEIDHIILKKTDKFIIVASDGLWEVMTSAEAVGFVLKNSDVWENDNRIAEMLAREARNRWEYKNSNNLLKNRISD